MEAIFSLIVIIPLAIIWLIPVVVILLSSRCTGGEKIAWLIAVFWISWFAFIFYLLLAPLNDSRSRS